LSTPASRACQHAGSLKVASFSELNSRVRLSPDGRFARRFPGRSFSERNGETNRSLYLAEKRSPKGVAC
jgi:hypothetical protein